MPLHGNSHRSSFSLSSFAHSNARHPSHDAAAGILQAAQTLGSIAVPANLRTTTSNTTAAQPTTSAGTDLFLDHPSSSSSSSRPTASMASSNPGATASYGLPSHPASGMTPQHRPAQYGRNPQDELHMQHPPRIAETSAHQISAAPLHSPMEPYASSSRPAAMNASHSYSRSSPAAAYDSYQGGMNSEASQNIASPSKYTPVSQRNVSSTPLGLADIRPRADSTISEAGLPGANPYSYDGASAMPTNSNYLAPWAIYAFDWCKWPAQNGDAGKVAVGSYLEDGHNFIQILESQITPTPGDSYTPGAPKYGVDFVKIAEATHSYPVTRLLWEPPSSQKQSTDLLATSGDHLRLWSLPSDTPMASPGNSINRSSSNHRELPPSKLTPLALLSNSKTPEHTAPLTSLDWNTVSPSLIITSSIDTTCTIWDIPTLTAKTQLIAHDKEVFDVRFCANSVDVFVSCGADGSVRMFDLRSLEHSTIIYEPTAKDDKDGSPGGRMSPTLAQQTMSYAPPLLRLAASPHDQHLLATFSQDSNIIRILDVRQPGQALLELRGHASSINCIEWSPSRRGTLASGADDSLVLVWDLLSQSTAAAPNPGASNTPENSRGPTASWRCDYEVGNISWAPHSALSNDGGDWLGVSGGRGIWGVKL